MFRQRALTAAVGLPLLFGLLYLDGFPWAFGLPLLALTLAVSMLGAEEFLHLVRQRGLHPPDDLGKMMGALPPLFLYFYRYQYNDLVLLGLTLIIMADVLMVALALIGDVSRRMARRTVGVTLEPSPRKKAKGYAPPDPSPGGTPGALRDFVVMAAGAIYVGGLMSYLLFLRRLDDSIAPPWGIWPVLLVIGAVWLSDTAAFAAGNLLDGPRLWPRVSPGKTVVGTIAGIAVSAAVFAIASAAGLFRDAFALEIGRAAAVGALIGVAGLGGDLAESALKRWAGVKDSGGLVPGHGGVLDRFDSLLWAAPVCYYLLAALRTV